MPPMRFSHCADQVRGFWRGWDDDLLSFYENTPLYPYTNRPTAFRQWYKKGSNRADTVRQLSQHSILFRSFPLHKIKIPFFPKIAPCCILFLYKLSKCFGRNRAVLLSFRLRPPTLPISPCSIFLSIDKVQNKFIMAVK